MNAKEKVQALINICDECNPKHETLFAVYATKEKCSCFSVGDQNAIGDSFYSILKRGIAGAEDNPNTSVAWAILGALRKIQDEGIDINELLTAFDEDDNDVEDSLDCEMFSRCQNERAKAWRTILETN